MGRGKGYLKILNKLLPYVRPHKVVFFLSILFDTLAIVVNSLIPVLSGYAVDTMIGGVGLVDFVLLQKYILAIIIATIISSIVDWLGSYYMNVLSLKTENLLRENIYAKLNSVPIKYIDNTSHGDILNTMVSDVSNITDGFLEGFKTIVCGFVQLISVAAIMLVSQWKLALVVMLLAPTALLFAIKLTKKSKKMYEQRVQVQGRLSGYAEEMIANMKVVKAFNNEQPTIDKFDKINEELHEASKVSMFYASLANPASRLVDGILYGITGVVGAFMAIAGNIRIGQISTFLNLSSNFTAPINNITNIFADLNIALASANRVFNLLEQDDEIYDGNLPELKKCNGEVNIKDVNFSYEPTFKLIENLNLKVKKGQRVAIVGPTGCGKSTLINLLMRFYDVNKGCIEVSGKDIRKIKRNSFRKYYGMVLQESWLYNATVRDNVAYGKPDASLDDVVEACKMANAHAFIEKLPQSYDTIITERGDNISAGQKQLLCIARIMLLKPPMMILDEATSNIDTMTEQNIQQALDTVMEGKTCFIVAHRLSTIENADVILVMNKGHIVEQGTHTELLSKKGFYYKLFNSQFGID